MADNTEESLRIAMLISKDFKGSINDLEAEELKSWINASEENRVLFSELTGEQAREKQLKQMRRYDTDAAFSRVSGRLTPHIVPLASYRRRIWQLARYAAILLLISGLGFAIFHIRQQHEKRTLTADHPYKNDIAPATNQAQLILSGGTTVALTKEQNKVISAGDLGIQTHNGVLSYKVKDHSAAATYNTMITPAGKTFEMILEDGTQVWLNAGSSLKYPTYFDGTERKVVLNGEAYFAVAHNPKRRFVVEVAGRQVEDIGTEFDVNNYNDNEFPAVALVKGSVKVTNGKNNSILIPGQKADMPGSGIDVSKADLKAFTAWKNGLFAFHNEPVTEMMKIIGRWYNARIVYATDYIPDNTFTGEISNKVAVSKLLDKIALTGIAEFTITGNTITVHPYKPTNH
ncbi:FecR family protein [Mucilaginibacter boryungensis]|uniref:FecR domain-containing protein n=1 Tax=Mucilaginibacter boryungensis TaxID=768480 RepID=A0ABR9XL74_9SPHI|nr:FecR domain-containing protein [Mucilaginibacter boryungensis]MBE9668136.1 FecR domain-containing protein [Mucilaginibacter boryungensis]